MSEELYEYSSAVRGYHYFRNYWQPTLGEELDCMHEKDNPFDFFAIKVSKSTTRQTVGHLPMKNSRATKFLLDRGAKVTARLSSSNYCVSPLVQGGLEIPCTVAIYMPRTLKNKQLIDVFKIMIESQIYPREESFVAGYFLATHETKDKHGERGGTRELKKKDDASTNNDTQKDIRAFFSKSERTQ